MLNQCQFIGNLGADPEIRTTQAGKKIANIRIAVSERWKDQQGNKQEKTEWVSVVCFIDGITNVVERFLRKGSKIFISGKLTTRKWTDQNGNDRYTTEVVLQGPSAVLTMLDSASGEGQRGERKRGYDDGDDFYEHGNRNPRSEQNRQFDELDDEVPF